MGIAAIWLVFFGLALLGRLPYPYDLEWMEGGMLAHGLHAADLYGPPRPDFVPFVYTPGLPWLLALVGPSPLAGRLLSLLGSLLAAGALGSMIRSRVLGLLCAVSFLATWSDGGAFFDLVRPDGLALGLLTVGLALTWHGRPGAAVFLVASFFFKQSAVFFFPAVWVAVYSRDGLTAALRSFAATVVPLVLGLAALQVWSGGYAWTYLFQVPSSHPLVWTRLFPLAWLELGAALPLTTAAAAALLLLQPGRRPTAPVLLAVALSTVALVAADLPALTALPSGLGLGAIGALAVIAATPGTHSWRARFLTVLACGALVGTVWMRAHHGGFVNVLIPGFWVLLLGFGLVLDRVPAPRWLAPTALALQLLLQGVRTPFAELTPTEADRRAGDALVERLKRIDGPIWSPYAVWLPTYAGHAPQAHLIGVWDLDHPGGPLHTEVQTFTDAMRTKHWGAVITSQRDLGFGLDASYRLRTQLHTAPGVLEPRSGWPVRLEAIWTPRP